MSYFMVVNGEKPDMTGLNLLTVSAVEEGQSYVSKCVGDFRKLGVFGDFWFIGDGYTGTSDEFVQEGIRPVWIKGTMGETVFYKVLKRCELAGNSIFIWYGNHDSHLNLPKVTAFEEMVQLIENNADPFQEPGFFYLNPKAAS